MCPLFSGVVWVGGSTVSVFRQGVSFQVFRVSLWFGLFESSVPLYLFSIPNEFQKLKKKKEDPLSYLSYLVFFSRVVTALRVRLKNLSAV